MADSVDTFLARLSKSEPPPQVCLVHGDLVLAEPAAQRIAETLARAVGRRSSTVETHRRPASLGPLLQDLRTYSLFASGKVVLAMDSAVLADRSAAGDLIDDAAEVVPVSGGSGGERSLSGRERQAASRLLQALHLFDLDPYAGAPERILSQPAGLGARRGQGAPDRRPGADQEAGGGAAVRAGRPPRSRPAGRSFRVRGEGDLSELAEVIRGGLPPGHALVLAEGAVAADHPVVRLLEERGAVLALGKVESDRGSWQGLDPLAKELERQTGVAITTDALAELARRTLRQESDRQGRGTGGVEADSTARLAGEYRKLANLLGRRGKDRPQARGADGGGPRGGGRLAAPRRHRGRPGRRGPGPPPPADLHGRGSAGGPALLLLPVRFVLPPARGRARHDEGGPGERQRGQLRPLQEQPRAGPPVRDPHGRQEPSRRAPSLPSPPGLPRGLPPARAVPRAAPRPTCWRPSCRSRARAARPTWPSPAS